MAKKYTKEELIEILRQLANELGRSPKKKEIKQFDAIKRNFGNLNNALRAAGLPLNREYSTYTNVDLIRILQNKADELGRPPTPKEIKQADTIKKRFGSFNNGLKAAGLPIIKEYPTPRKYTDDELIEILKQKEIELGRPPKYTEVKQKKAIANHFGSFTKGLLAAGLTPQSKQDKYTNDELIEIIKKRAQELGRPPKQREIKEAFTIKKRFGSFTKGLKAAGFELEHLSSPYTTEQLIEIIQKKAKKLGRAPKSEELKERSSIMRHFGSYNKALEAAGLIPNQPRYTEEELIEILQNKAKELGRSPKIKEVKQGVTIAYRFGSFNNALMAAGLPLNRKRRKTNDQE